MKGMKNRKTPTKHFSVTPLTDAILIHHQALQPMNTKSASMNQLVVFGWEMYCKTNNIKNAFANCDSYSLQPLG